MSSNAMLNLIAVIIVQVLRSGLPDLALDGTSLPLVKLVRTL